MRSILKLGWIGMLVLGIVACSKTGEMPFGVHVGNGMKPYASPYGYTVNYNEQLTLNIGANAKDVEIDNRELTSQDVSALKISIIENTGIKDKEALREFGRLDSRLAMNHVPQEGAVAVQGQRRDNVSLVLTRYLLLPSGLIVKFALNAFQVAQGIALLQPVVEQVQVDKTPPVITDVKWDAKRLSAGRTATVFLQVDEDLSGVSDATLKLVRLNDDGTASAHRQGNEINAKVAKTNTPGWYALEYPISEYFPAGTYIPSIGLRDHAGNYGGYGYNPDFFADVNYNRGLKGRIEVENIGRADTTGPKITSMEFPREMTPGKEFVISFTATDDVSGIRLGKNGAFMLRLIKNGRWESLAERGTIQEKPIIRKGAGKNEYEIVGTLSHYYVGGERILDAMQIYDYAGNVANVSCSFLDNECQTYGDEITHRKYERKNIQQYTQVKDIGVDAEYPKVSSVEMTPRKLKAGESLTLKVVLNKPYLDDQARVFAAIRPFENGAFSKDEQKQKDTFYLDQMATKVAGKSAFTVVLKTHRWMPRGDFALASVSVEKVYPGAWFDDVRNPNPEQAPTLLVE